MGGRGRERRREGGGGDEQGFVAYGAEAPECGDLVRAAHLVCLSVVSGGEENGRWGGEGGGGAGELG